MWTSAALRHVHLASPPPTTDLDLRLHTRCDGFERASSPGRKEGSERRKAITLASRPLHRRDKVEEWKRERKHHSFFGSPLLPSSSLGPLSSLSSNNACGGKKKTIHSIIHVREAATAAPFDLGQGLTRGGATFELSFEVLS